MNVQPEKPQSTKWRYCCCGKEACRVRKMNLYELRRARIQYGLRLGSSALLILIFSLIGQAIGHSLSYLVAIPLLLLMVPVSFSTTTGLSYLRCAIKQDVLVFLFDQDDLANSSVSQCKVLKNLIELSSPCEVEIWMPSKLAMTQDNRPHWRWLRWMAPSIVPVVRYAAPDLQSIAEYGLTREDRLELIAKLGWKPLSQAWDLVCACFILFLVKRYQETHAVLWPAAWDLGLKLLLAIVLLTFIRKSLRILLLALDIAFGRLNSNLGRTSIWLRYSRVPWIIDGHPAEWRTAARLTNLPEPLPRNVTKRAPA